MLRNGHVRLRQMRPYNNLPYEGDGRKMTAFMTPYRAWMWKQQELWRKVHEAQFEHFRGMYKRQWLEAFRSNADEYIYKYNITKAHTLRVWEHEMEQQEAERLKQVHQAGARAALKKKHLDILLEYHERHFFQWYERASERLQYFSRMKWVQRDDIDAHIERELNKYVKGKETTYPLNFVGQMPMIEDENGGIVEVPEGMANLHQAQFHDTMPAEVYEPPQVLDADAVLREQISGADADLEMLTDEEREAMEDIVSVEESLTMRRTKVAKAEEATKEELELERRKQILKHSGGVGAKAFIKASRPSKDTFTVTPEDSPTTGAAAASSGKAARKGSKKAPTSSAAGAGAKRSKKAPKELKGAEADKVFGVEVKSVKVGEVASKTPKIQLPEDRLERAMNFAESEEGISTMGRLGGSPRGARSASADGGRRKKKDDDDDDGSS